MKGKRRMPEIIGKSNNYMANAKRVISRQFNYFCRVPENDSGTDFKFINRST